MFIFSLIIIVLLLLLSNLFYTYPRIKRAYRLAHSASIHTGRFLVGDPNNKHIRLLVLGDSAITGQGIAKFSDSAGGRFACMLGTKYYVEYENRAGMGKWIGDIDHEQVNGSWDISVLAIGSNDLVHGAEITTFKNELDDLLTKMSSHSKYVIVAGPGDLSHSKIFPWWYRSKIRKRGVLYARVMSDSSSSIGAHYFNTMTLPEMFRHLSRDGLHLGVKGNHLLAQALWQMWLESKTETNNNYREDELESVQVRT